MTSDGTDGSPVVPVPTALLFDPSISDGAKVLWALLYQLQLTGGTDDFELGLVDMAKLSGAAKGSAMKRRDELEVAGWLRIVKMPGLARVQRIHVVGPGEHRAPVEEPTR